MAANGRILIGFAHPVVAKYDPATATYSGGRILARGVKCALSLDTADNNDFYADDVLAESENGLFAGGTATITVDGMHPAAERFALGLPEPEKVTYGESSETVELYKYGDAARPPYLGYGHVVTYRSDGVDTYVPTILTKIKFRVPGGSAETRGEKISYQTQELTADLHRDDTSTHDWKWVGADQTSMEAAVKILHGLLKVTEGDA